MENRDQRRWAIADEDDDGALNKIEFKHFLHPEEADHMRDIVVQVRLDSTSYVHFDTLWPLKLKPPSFRVLILNMFSLVC